MKHADLLGRRKVIEHTERADKGSEEVVDEDEHGHKPRGKSDQQLLTRQPPIEVDAGGGSGCLLRG